MRIRVRGFTWLLESAEMQGQVDATGAKDVTGVPATGKLHDAVDGQAARLFRLWVAYSGDRVLTLQEQASITTELAVLRKLTADLRARQKLATRLGNGGGYDRSLRTEIEDTLAVISEIEEFLKVAEIAPTGEFADGPAEACSEVENIAA